MTIPEKIEDALSKGQLNFYEVKKIVYLFQKRKEADEYITKHGDDDKQQGIIERSSNEIIEIINNAKLWANERLAIAEKKMR